MFGLLKKKKPESTLELPPPPSPPGFEKPAGDIPSIQPATGPEELAEFPTVPEAELEVPAPEMPEIPKPEYERKEEYEKPEMPELVPVDGLSLEREVVRKPLGPTFVSVDEYRNILDHSNRVRAKLAEAEEFMHSLEEVRVEEEKTFEKWRGQLEDVERKLAHIDRVIERAKR